MKVQRPVTDDALRSEARHAARTAAHAAGVSVALISGADDSHAAAETLARIWPRENGTPPIEPNLLRALNFGGNYVALARGTDGDVVGACVGFLADPGALHLHSHIAGVLPGSAGRGVGRALKLHQRAWALEHDIGSIVWTFDPLIARNAYFNLARLGADVVAFAHDFYGAMLDARNHGHGSDRLVVEWKLRSDRVVALAHGQPPSPEHVPTHAARWIPGGPGLPVRSRVTDESAQTAVIAVPPDIERLRRDDPRSAADWREVVGEALRATVGAGTWSITGFVKNEGYLLEAHA